MATVFAGEGGRPPRLGGPRLLGQVLPRGPHPRAGHARQLLGHGRHGALRPVLGGPLLPGRPPALRRGGRRPPVPRRCLRVRPLDRDLEPRLHAVQPGREGEHGSAARPLRGHGHGARAPGGRHPGQVLQLRHGPHPAPHPGGGAHVRRAYGEGRGRRTSPCASSRTTPGRPPSSSPTASSPPTRGAATSCARSCAAPCATARSSAWRSPSSRTSWAWSARDGGGLPRDRGAPEDRGDGPPHGGGILRGHHLRGPQAAPRGDRRPHPAQRQGDPRRRPLQALRHLRLPHGPGGGHRQGAGPHPRHGGLRGLHGEAARDGPPVLEGGDGHPGLPGLLRGGHHDATSRATPPRRRRAPAASSS